MLAIVPTAPDSLRPDLELALGNLLLKHGRPEEAVTLLEAAVTRGTDLEPYARILLARALVDAGGQTARAAGIAAGVAAEHSTSILTDEALYLLVKAAMQVKDHLAVIEAAERFLDAIGGDRGKGTSGVRAGVGAAGRWSWSRRVDDVEWYLAQAFDSIGSYPEAYSVYEDVWYGAPGSPHALAALKRLTELGERFDFEGRVLPGNELFDFIVSLRSAGRHPQALGEIERFKRDFPDHSRIPDALYYEASSSYHARENSRAVEAAETLRDRFPGTDRTPAAIVYAIRALRRESNTAAIRRWCEHLMDEYPRHDKAYEGLYNLAGYIANAGFARDSESLLEESRSVYQRIIQEGGRREVVKDAFWGYTWFQIRTRDRQAAVGTLEDLLERFPRTGYRPGALFWIGKLRLEAGDTTGASRSLLKVVEESPYGYYGQRSLEHLDALGVVPERTGSNRVFPEIDNLDRPRGRHHYDMAVRLKGVGLYEFAARHLASDGSSGSGSGSGVNPGIDFAMADLLAASGWGTQAIRQIRATLGPFIQEGGQNVPDAFWRIVYPLHYWSQIQAEAERHELDPWLVVALIRRESLFDRSATSPAGALGLMQIMPYTAPEIARDLGLDPPADSDLYDPALNIRLGVHYLAGRIHEFDGDVIPAICSYNAGVGPVRRWLRDNETEDLDEWIELIQYRETRLYLKGILGDLHEYRRIYD
jgi:outer membrane protein assembly factor BamD (BamD/ComL family)